MTRGRPFQPGNQSGRGRPRGSRNKQTEQAHQLFEKYSEPILRMAIHQAQEDPRTLRLLASRVLGRPRDLPVKIGPLPMETLEDLDRASVRIAKRTAAGKLSPAQAADLFKLLETRRRVLETRDLERRLSALENSAPQGPG